ncbi:MAG: CRISPR-associated endonuclease Cas1 [Candidatus Aquicultor secundus]|uniref:CRISPR-associated endonuclease Cas1 n=1 Tax=Candidatus Aquicultor secundus TaxID=1973895 RepID=A0A2M7T6Q3_9ACTN|nr:CRISPR-associated endonuclease Cas1 [Candidatus Aquicultor secundus]OIO88993.1 MAG: CRISPR-associated endonuclease Cas1 [Candidatus Aquicultor secundus]PIU27668.1 MAG: CRISPR-associated endonuclease Cas1 [Candidatus Aquicultor secundus]PIW22478.1 MAG: CRISPR-associated endonuclease Cas1 [Candidatus Aquicultor secundus]PIX52702.1 MAG: CRISPR-associated endonuclease Cas1 [Candidatus Aquicultor secundus]PIY37631.1 MAG: CRISPR-associated endonuclease Cas1 [Candidatus Aquicultor secundus]
MATLYVTEQGAVVHKRGERLVITKDGKRLKEVPSIYLDKLVIVGNVSITTPAISFLLDEGIDTVYLSTRGRYKGRLQPEYSKNILLRQRQFRKAEDPVFRLTFTRAIVAGKALNQRNRCLRILRNRTINSDSVRQELDVLRAHVNTATDIAILRALEGEISRRYFSVIRGSLNEAFSFSARRRRPPTDPVNVLLSFSYALLKNAVFSSISATGLDPYQGFYHVCKYGRPALVLDVMEEFRPIIADAVVLNVINNRVIEQSDFIQESDGMSLSDAGIEKVIIHFNKKLSSEFEHPYFRYQTDFRQCIDLQARFLAKHILGYTDEYYPHISR